MTEFPETGRLAGIDYGTVRIGVAVCDPGRRVASPYENYARRDGASDARYFQQLVWEENIVGFIVGLPLHVSGEESEKSREARVFADWLATVTKIPVRFHDERYTTREATNLLGTAHMSKKKRKRRLDMLAAQVLLSAYLESSRHDIPPGRLDD